MATDPLKIDDLIARAVQTGNTFDNEMLIESLRKATKSLEEAYLILVRSQWGSSSEVELINKALRIAGSPERLVEWLQTPVPSLNGQSPYALMQSEEGRKQVEDVLGRIEHGVY